jgi:uncharacterized protein YciI
VTPVLFALIAYDKPNGLPDRLKARPNHLKFLESLGDSLKLAGAFLDPAGEMNGSMVVVEAENQGAAEALFGADPYLQRGVFGSYEIRPYRIAINKLGG